MTLPDVITYSQPTCLKTRTVANIKDECPYWHKVLFVLHQHYIQRGKIWLHVSNLSSLTKAFKTKNHFTSEPQDLVVLTVEILPYMYMHHFTRKKT